MDKLCQDNRRLHRELYRLRSASEAAADLAATTQISYFQVTWANAMGTERSFGIQAAICLAAYFLVVFMQVFGKRIRERSGPLRFKTD